MEKKSNHSLQRGKWWPIYFNAFERTLVASWKLNHLFSDDSLSLKDFQRYIAVAYLGVSVPRKSPYKKFVAQVNEDFPTLRNERGIVKRYGKPTKKMSDKYNY